MGRHVATFMVHVHGQVESDELLDWLSIEAHHVGEIASEILARGRVRHRSFVVKVMVDFSRDSLCLRNDVEAVLEGRFPVFGTMDASSVSSSELALSLTSQHTSGELGHGVHLCWEVVYHALHVGWQLTSLTHLTNESVKLLLVWILAGQQQPEDGLRSSDAILDELRGQVHDLVQGFTSDLAFCSRMSRVMDPGLSIDNPRARSHT